MLELAPDGVFAADSDGTCCFVNGAGCAMLDRERDHVIGRPLPAFLAKSDLEHDEWMLRRRDGTSLAVEVRTTTLADGRWISYVRDLSAQKAQALEREALHEEISRDRRWLHAVMETLPLGLLLFHADGKLSANTRAQELLGMTVSPDGGSAQYANRILYADGRPVPAHELASSRVLRDGATVFGAEFRLRRPDGTEIPVLGSAAPMRDSDGTIVGGVGVFQDVSERMTLERAVRDNERVLKAVFDILPVGVSRTDCQGRIVDSNPAAAALRAAIGEAPAQPGGEVRAWRADTGAPINADEWPLARALKTRVAATRELVRVACADGAFRTIIQSAAPLHDDQGRVTGAIAVNEDVTALYQTQEQLRAAVRDREHILAIVAHDLRNPLSSIALRAALAEQMAQSLAGGEELRSAAASITVTTERMAGLVDDLLAVSTMRSGRPMLDTRPVSPGALLADAARNSEQLLAQAGLSLVVEQAAELPSVHIDLNRMLRVFGNLLDNAIKFTQRGGGVEMRAVEANGAVLFSVANTGAPLHMDQMQQLFQPFWQAGHQDRRGAGLGLSICRSIVESHGGSIWGEAAQGMRLRVCILLPCAGPAAAARATASGPG